MLADLDFDYQGIDVLFDEDEDSDEETTSADDSTGENEDNNKRVKRSKEKVYLEKLNIFMEENAPFPKSDTNSLNKTDISFKRGLSTVAYGNTSASFKNLDLFDTFESSQSSFLAYGKPSASFKNPDIFDTFENSQSSSGVSQNVCTQTIFEKVFENAIEKSSVSRNQHGDNHSFTSNRPQDKRFRYGGNSSSSSSALEPEKEKNNMDRVSKETKKGKHTSVKTPEEVKSSDNTSSDDTHNLNEQTLKNNEVADSRNKKVFPCERSPHEDHHKIKQDKRFRYGSEQASEEKPVTQKKKEKRKERKRSDNLSKAGYPKTSSPKTRAQDPRLKQSTDESESSVEYLITSPSAETDPSSDEQPEKKSAANPDTSDMSISIISPEKEVKHESDSNISENKETKECVLKSESTMSLDVSGQSGKL